MSDGSNSVQKIPFYAHPHVHVVINDNTWYDETVSTPSDPTDKPFATVVVTGADQGIDNTFVRLSDLDTKTAIFGQGNYQKYGQSSIQADLLFDGNTSVWFCRVLPDDATYANMAILAHYRKGYVLNDAGNETGLQRMEIKFSTVYVDDKRVVGGATNDNVLLEAVSTLTKDTADELNGYMTVPIAYVRSTGRGVYGNQYSLVLRRDSDAEKEYGAKMYKWGVVTNVGDVSKLTNIFSGSLYQTTKYNMSTIISDVLDQYTAGSCPIYIYPFEKNFDKLWNFYSDIVTENEKILSQRSAYDEELADLKLAKSIREETFDPIFGYVFETRSDEIIPYYKNYTAGPDGAYVPPTFTIQEWTDDQLGDNAVAEAIHAGKIGDTLEVLRDTKNNGGKHWRYTIVTISDKESGIPSIQDLDAGYECHAEDKEYDGTDLTVADGVPLAGGSDGLFGQVEVDGVKRAPSAAEMKLLLAAEEVKAFRGEKDRKILSPARTNVDFIYDANYNMTADGELKLEDQIQTLYDNSTVLTDEDYRELQVTEPHNFVDYSDINVKKAMFDLVQFRNRNGMTISEDMGAGCSLYLDCGLVGLKTVNASGELLDVISMFNSFVGRDCSIDLGSYEIYEPVTGKRVPVTVTYFIAEHLIPHIMANGLNKPFTYSFAQLQAYQRTRSLTNSNSMIRDTFKPDIDLIDWDVKETLFTNRINYYLTREEGRLVERACQNTRQMDASALLEENNVRVLNTLKKGLEEACRSYLYDWNEPEARKGYTDSQMAIYRPWIGTMVQDIDIRFEANEWESDRMILHCYASVAFRNIVKRIILEISINRPEY